MRGDVLCKCNAKSPVCCTRTKHVAWLTYQNPLSNSSCHRILWGFRHERVRCEFTPLLSRLACRLFLKRPSSLYEKVETGKGARRRGTFLSLLETIRDDPQCWPAGYKSPRDKTWLKSTIPRVTFALRPSGDDGAHLDMYYAKYVQSVWNLRFRCINAAIVDWQVVDDKFTCMYTVFSRSKVAT